MTSYDKREVALCLTEESKTIPSHEDVYMLYDEGGITTALEWVWSNKVSEMVIYAYAGDDRISNLVDRLDAQGGVCTMNWDNTKTYQQSLIDRNAKQVKELIENEPSIAQHSAALDKKDAKGDWSEEYPYNTIAYYGERGLRNLYLAIGQGKIKDVAVYIEFFEPEDVSELVELLKTENISYRILYGGFLVAEVNYDN